MIKQIVIGLLGAVLIAWGLIGLAKAQEAYVMPVERWSPHVSQHGYKAPRHIRRLKREARREKRARIWAPPVRHVAKVIRPEIPVDGCQRIAIAVGTEHESEEDAKSAAVKAWRSRVLFEHGSRFGNVDKAREATFECAQSSTGNRYSDRAQEARGKAVQACRFIARPCPADIERLGDL